MQNENRRAEDAPRIERSESEWVEYIVRAKDGPGFEKCVAYALASWGEQCRPGKNVLIVGQPPTVKPIKDR